jgi:endogenous inhibitor of DNA gyrase (YacG/DUF329 family)
MMRETETSPGGAMAGLDGFLIAGLIGVGKVRCPKCGEPVTASKHFRAHVFQVPVIGSATPLIQDEGFSITLVCGTCGAETNVDEHGFEACLNRG